VTDMHPIILYRIIVTDSVPATAASAALPLERTTLASTLANAVRSLR